MSNPDEQSAEDRIKELKEQEDARRNREDDAAAQPAKGGNDKH